MQMWKIIICRFHENITQGVAVGTDTIEVRASYIWVNLVITGKFFFKYSTFTWYI